MANAIKLSILPFLIKPNAAVVRVIVRDIVHRVLVVTAARVALKGALFENGETVELTPDCPVIT